MANVGAFFKKTLPSMALTVASGVPGPIGMVAGLISQVLGKTIKPDPLAIDTAIQGATPDQIIALQEKDLDVKTAMAKMGYDDLEEMARIAEQDVANARARQVALNDHTAPALAWVIIAGAFTVIVAVLCGFAKVEAALAGTLIGYVVAMAQQVVAYYFGSSAGSAAKTQIMAGQANGGK